MAAHERLRVNILLTNATSIFAGGEDCRHAKPDTVVVLFRAVPCDEGRLALPLRVGEMTSDH